MTNELRSPNTSPAPMLVLVAFMAGIVGGILGTIIVSNESVAGLLGGLTNNKVGSPDTQLRQNITLDENSVTIDVVKAVQPAVVSVIGSQDLSELRRSPFGIAFGSPLEGQQQVSGGSGFIIRPDGLIVTNKHVVNQDGVSYSIVLDDGSEYEATIISLDPTNDIAFLDIEATDLPTVTLGDSDILEVGQTVIAIGNVLGRYENSVTRGIVSGLARTIEAGGSGFTETLEDTIQTDAAINSGNSGGPLLNIAGQVVGLNTAISSQGQLVGFAIPINQAATDIASIEEFGEIIRPYLGVRYIAVNKQLQNANDLTVDYGALIVRGSTADQLAVMPGSPADKAGLVENDIILEVNGVKITEEHSLGRVLAELKPGDIVTLKILHDGEEGSVTATLDKRNE
jgi:serine protease Do